ncbi:hypothetical protein [Schinkia azotoformans]|uniref:hypothetical protein n=1 Tax=Schinkia azotoformans TaxID=1454 RepID=UPI002DBD3BFD|nr:hypothetical protein [Schinkia azotoformans]MEC1778400.1 hypothetical protein [Schinkia azotoformans]MED4328355.1 hypothetical protein [Schinkia azotoformans]
MIIVPIELKDIEIFFDEDTQEYKPYYKNEKKYPAFITNHSLKLGKDLGLTKSSLVGDLFKLQGLDSKNQEDIDNAMQSLDQTEMQKVIYLGFLGANKNTDLDFDGFLEKFHCTFEETIEIYMKLVTGLLTQDSNKFADNLKRSVGKKGKKK